MAKIAIITDDVEKYRVVVDSLDEHGDTWACYSSAGGTAAAGLCETPPDLIIVDETLTTIDGLALVRELLEKNAFFSIAVASDRPPDEFHEVSEGLGVVMQLGDPPGTDDVRKVMDYLR